MLSFGLVLLFATSALTGPVYSPYDYVTLDLSSDVGVAKNSGRANHLTDGLSSLVDGGGVSIYIVTMQHVLNDIGSLNDRYSQAHAVGGAVGASVALATGIPGDACLSARLADAYAKGNYRSELKDFITHIAQNLDNLVKLVKNPQSARFSVGPQSNCKGGGRTYQFEAAWNKIIDNANPSNAGLINEQYCAAKRLYNSLYVLNNNVGAVVTASSLPPVVKAYANAYGPIVNLINALVGNENPYKALEAAKRALINSV